MTRLRGPAEIGVARERCRQYWCPTAGDYACVRHHGPTVCCQQPQLHRDTPSGYCTLSPERPTETPPPAPGPDPYPDEVRIEFELPGRDMYAAWKSVAASAEAGWSPEECWLTYGETVPRTWDWMCHHWGHENLTTNVTVLIPATGTLTELLAFKKLQVALDGGRRWWDETDDPQTSEEDDMPG